MNLETYKDSLNASTKQNLVRHFNYIYECKELTAHEYKIAFLAYLWKSGRVASNAELGYEIINEKELGLELHKDYEITFEAGEGNEGGVNFNLMYEYYLFEQLKELK